MQHLLTLQNWDRKQIEEVVTLAGVIKRHPDNYASRMERKNLFMIFEKPSLRTRVSFEVGMHQMGGHAIYYDLSTSPLGSGKENVHDTVKTVSRYGDLIMARLFKHETLVQMAQAAGVPVINGLTDFAHPCQILSDLQTIQEHKNTLDGISLAYLGDSNNNVTHSLLFGCSRMGLNIRVGCPRGVEFEPSPDVVNDAREAGGQTGSQVLVTHEPDEAVEGADVVYTDSWMSYHIQQDQMQRRIDVLKPYQVSGELMSHAAEDAIFMNCLPAMREYEQTAEVIDGPQSVVFDQAENRLHAQKALMILLMEKAG